MSIIFRYENDRMAGETLLKKKEIGILSLVNPIPTRKVSIQIEILIIFSNVLKLFPKWFV